MNGTFRFRLGTRVAACLTLMLLLASAAAFGQARTTGVLRGEAVLQDGTPVPGVLATATSPVLQGTRTTATNESGEWILRNLPPGAYTVTFELEGMATVQAQATVSLGQETPIDVTMEVAATEETIIVTSDRSSLVSSSEVSTTYDFEEVNNLPIARTPSSIAALAPGLTTNTPNGGQVTISGGFAYDNVFLIDGVDANDNLFGVSNPVYIEDAIADVQVLTSGISAAYGRFSGGVVNVVTKSGGNQFDGTLRTDLSDDDWRERTPVEIEDGTEVTGPTNETYSATLGGYVLRDRLWFFGAGRDTESTTSDTFSGTGLPQTNITEEDRYELKLTGNIRDRHQVQAQYTEREQTATSPSFSFSATPDTLRTRTDPNELSVARYSGILSPALFLELQASEKEFTFMNSHGLDASTVPGTQSFIENSPFFDFFGDFGRHYHSPYFDGKDPEDRNNEQIAGTVSFFLDSPAAGTHDLKVGVEDFSSFRTGGNSQSPTNWVMSADVLTDANGDPVLGADNTLTPVWQPGASGAWNWQGNRNAEIEINTQSFFVNDTWQLTDRWSFNIGFRYEQVDGESQSGITTVDSDALVPRLAASYDLKGDGRYRFDVTYAQYSGKYSETQFAENTDVGNPPGLLFIYLGESGQGFDFTPAYDFFGPDYAIVAADDGTQNILIDPSIQSPVVDEFTLGFGTELGRGYLKAVYTDREYNDFIEDFVTTETGTTDVIVDGVSAGTFSNTLIGNSDLPERKYQALQLIGRYRLLDRLSLGGSYTYQIENEGNFEGEATNQPGISSVLGDYPEIRSAFQHFPIGDLNDFAEHKLRTWANYNLPMGRAGNLNFALLVNYDTGLTLSATDTVQLTDVQRGICDDLGYVDCPTNQTIFFGQRGGVEFDDTFTLDVGINYQLKVFRDLILWLKADVLNVFDDDTQFSGENDVTANFDGPLDSLGLPLTFTPDPDFRKGTDNANYITPRLYRFTVGFRF